MDGRALAELMIDHDLGTTTTATYAIDRIHPDTSGRNRNRRHPCAVTPKSAFFDQGFVGGWRVPAPSRESLVTPHIQGLPFEKRLALDAAAQGRVIGQNRSVDLSSLQQQVQER